MPRKLKPYDFEEDLKAFNKMVRDIYKLRPDLKLIPIVKLVTAVLSDD